MNHRNTHLAKDPRLETCETFASSGATDHGIDLYAPLKNQTGLYLAQCKSYKSFSPAQIKAVSKVFFDNWENVWKGKSVKRFILFLGCDLTAVKGIQEVASPH